MYLRRLPSRISLSVVSSLLSIAVGGCGGSGNNQCFIQSITVSPPSATADHAAASPGNQQQFAAFASKVPQDCAVTQSNLTNVLWSVSDPVNVDIGATSGPSFGAATCKAATSGAITVKATLNQADFAPVEATASFTCN